MAISTICCLLTSCKDDDVVINSESKILSFTFANEIVVGKKASINNETKKISFTVLNSATDEQIKALVPTITVSAKATISPASGVATDFTNPVTYTVTPEDGITKTVYEVTCTRESGSIADKELDGVYKGSLDIKLDGQPVGQDILQKIYIAKVGENLISIELKNFFFNGIPLGNIKVDKNTVVKAAGKSAFTGSQEIALALPGKYEAKIEGEIVGDALDIEITVEIVGIGEVLVDFKGTELAVDQSSEALITSFTFDASKDANKIVVDKAVINNQTRKISVTVLNSATDEQIKALVPTIEISEKATVSPASGVASASGTYTVTPEDEINKTEYEVICTRVQASIEANELDGEYDGTLDIKLDGTLVGPDIEQKIHVAKVGENLISIELKNFVFNNIPLGNIKVDKNIVVKAAGKSTFTGSQKITLTGLGGLECDAEIVGEIINGTIDIDITVKIDGVGEVLVDFKGDKL